MKSNILIGGLILLLVSCTKENGSNSNNGGGGSTSNTISMKNSVFSPASLQVNINATVTWTNDDNMTHTVTADNGSFNSGDIAPGGRFSYTFSSTGTINYHCNHHQGMTGTIIVAGIR